MNTYIQHDLHAQLDQYIQLKTEEQRRDAAALFEGWQETMIWSALQNIQGRVFGSAGENLSLAAAQGENLSSAAAVLGDFCFLAGKPDKGLVEFAAGLEGYPFSMCILVPQNEGWEKAIEEHLGDRARKITRYATKKNPKVFERSRLAAMAANIPEGYRLKFFDEPLYRQALSEEWSLSLAAQFEDYPAFARLGIGIAAVDAGSGSLAAGAASYSRYDSGIEIEIDTHPNHRMQGLARCCGARLILECLDRGLYPSWDAHNPESLHLAERFGYEPAGTYTAYEVDQEK